MSRESVNCAILFADIAKSSHIYEMLGSELAQAIIDRCLSHLAAVSKRHNGVVVKTIGDAILCTFPTAEDAAKAARQMNRSLVTLAFPEKPGYRAPDIYVGIHYGPVIDEDGEISGDAVNVAGNMAALAKQRQIITTQETVDQLTPATREQVHPIDTATIKGASGDLDIFEIVWKRKGDADLAPAQPIRIELRLGDKVVKVDEQHPTAGLGRQLYNDIVVPSNRASRSHARIEYHRGKFVLIDQSTNGTFVTVQGKPAAEIKRGELVLTGSGLIGLGEEASADAPDAIHYTVKM